MSNCSQTESNCGSNQTHDDVKNYYGKHLSNTKDLKTSACAAPAKPLPKHIKDALSEIHEDITSRYFGCGLTVPQCLESCRILDLGSGSGRDCYILSKLVGPMGHVTGIDMTDEQLELSRKYIDYHTQKFGYQQTNVDFTKGYIENLKGANLQDETFNVVVSNCVINLSPDKKAVLSEVYRVLKYGGEMFFSDMYINKTLSEELKKNKMVWGEGIGGALLWKDLFQFAEEIGFSPPRLVTSRYITFNKELQDVVGDYKLVSATFRLFKVPKCAKKEKCLAIYKGGVTGYENEIQFDANFSFKEGQAVEVDEELHRILKSSRFAEHFTFHPLEKGSGSIKDIISDPFQLAN
ncbi:arsenite methyltransferase-like [Hyla sarda]|uniref:arsenite methyltransferase-like n=1 Tax=Hyla sarda TaxID=327740 RepID=UPI0024C25E1C|nr:arsenite methyltransferase-like [Hyla sarda]XP_056385628.1 arsenite methyltransferase-like [Hyla sarda]